MRWQNRPPYVSVIIATRDRADSLRRCLESFLGLDYPSFEIVVVDNAPKSAATRQLVKDFRRGFDLSYVLEERPGLAVAHNAGALLAAGELLAFTDDDVEVESDWLAELVDGFRAAPNVGCVTGAIMPAELETTAQSLLEEFGGYYKGPEQTLFDLGENRPVNPLFPYSAGVFGGGANMAFSREALVSVGGFDPALGAGTKAMGGDDLAAFFDVVTNGFTLVYQPTAVVRHYHRRDYDGLRRTVYGYGVGLTAYLTRIIVDKPGRVLEMLPKVPQAARHIFSSGSSKNRKKGNDYPRELTWAERSGMLKGPTAFVASHLATRRLRSQRWSEFNEDWLAKGAGTSLVEKAEGA